MRKHDDLRKRAITTGEYRKLLGIFDEDPCCGYCQWKARKVKDKDNTRTWKKYRKHQYKDK